MSGAKKALTITGITLGVILIAGAATAAYFGVLPGLSGLFGANKPRDLGVTYTQADYTSGLAKLNNTQILDFAAAPAAPAHPADTIIFTDPQAITATLTSSELTARANLSTWADKPAKNIQIKINPDGTVELSCTLLTDRLRAFASAVGNAGYSDADVDQAANWLNMLGSDPALYVKSKASIANNVPSVATAEIQLNRIAPPAGLTDDIAKSVANTIISRIPGLDVKSVTFEAGGLRFDGTAPTKLYVKQ